MCEVEHGKLCPAPEQETAGLMKPGWAYWLYPRTPLPASTLGPRDLYWTESSTLPLFEDILDKCPYLLKISYAIVSQWNKLRQNASKHLEQPCYPLMLHEQRTGHFTAFTLLCLACVKAYNSKDEGCQIKLDIKKSPSHNLRNKNDKINISIVTFIFNNGWDK